jgi:rubredoxin
MSSPLAGCDNCSPLKLSCPESTMSEVLAYRTWMCVVCGFVYDEADGLPEEGIAPGTRWEDIPEDWVCPDCGVTKSDFEMMPL